MLALPLADLHPRPSPSSLGQGRIFFLKVRFEEQISSLLYTVDDSVIW